MHFYDDGWGEHEYYSDQIERLEEKIAHYEVAIRKHRDMKGDDRCWLDDEELYNTLPEKYFPPARDSKVELCNCAKFIESRHNPKVCYVSPDVEIAKLREENENLRAFKERVIEAADTKFSELKTAIERVILG